MRTWDATFEVELPKVKGSRFIGRGGPCTSESEAMGFVLDVRRLHRKASHTAFGWVLADGSVRSGDDGEVSNTAGPPILARLEGAGLRGVVVTVTRYYGGVNLGKGGLVRAYGASSAAVVAGAECVERVQQVTRRVEVDAAHGSAVMTALARAGFQLVRATWSPVAVFVVRGPEPTEARARLAVLEAGRGTATWSS